MIFFNTEEFYEPSVANMLALRMAIPAIVSFYVAKSRWILNREKR